MGTIYGNVLPRTGARAVRESPRQSRRFALPQAGKLSLPHALKTLSHSHRDPLYSSAPLLRKSGSRVAILRTMLACFPQRSRAPVRSSCCKHLLSRAAIWPPRAVWAGRATACTAVAARTSSPQVLCKRPSLYNNQVTVVEVNKYQDLLVAIALDRVAHELCNLSYW